METGRSAHTPGLRRAFAIGATSLMTVFAVLALMVEPAAAGSGSFPALPITPFGLWAPNYCATMQGTAAWAAVSGNFISMNASETTASWTSTSGRCNSTASPAGYNVFAAQVEYFWDPSGTGQAVRCNYAHAVNPSGAASVTAQLVNDRRCPSGYYYNVAWSARITYGGSNQNQQLISTSQYLS